MYLSPDLLDVGTPFQHSPHEETTALESVILTREAGDDCPEALSPLTETFEHLHPSDEHAFLRSAGYEYVA